MYPRPTCCRVAFTDTLVTETDAEVVMVDRHPHDEGGSEQPARRFWPGVLRGGICVVASFMALQELGIATTIVTSAFIIGLAAIAVAGAVAFGLGNRDLAGEVMRDRYEQRSRAREDEELPGEESTPLSPH